MYTRSTHISHIRFAAHDTGLTILPKTVMTRSCVTQRSIRKDEPIPESQNDIIHTKRGCSENDLPQSEIQRRKQKDILLTNQSIQPTCVDFSGDCERRYPEYYFVMAVRDGINRV